MMPSLHALGAGLIAVVAAAVSAWLLHLWDARQARDIDRPWWRTWRRAGLIVPASYGYGLFGHIALDWLLTVIPLVAASVALAFAYRVCRSGFWPYQLEQFALWTAFASGWMSLAGPLWGRAPLGAIFYWSVSAVVGGLVLKVRAASRPGVAD